MPRPVTFNLVVQNGLVQSYDSAYIAETDLPTSGVNPGEYSLPIIRVDQYGRVTEATSGSIGGGAAGGVVFLDTNGMPTTFPTTFTFDPDGSLGDLGTESTLYVGDTLNQFDGVLALWDSGNAAWVPVSVNSGGMTIPVGLQVDSIVAAGGSFTGTVDITSPGAGSPALNANAHAGQTVNFVNLTGLNGAVSVDKDGFLVIQSTGGGFFGIKIKDSGGTVQFSVECDSGQIHTNGDFETTSGFRITAFGGYVGVLAGNRFTFENDRIEAFAGIRPLHQADAAATNDTIYYSTTAGKLVYKDSGGVVNNLY